MKDRIVKNILDKAKSSGNLRPGGTVVAASSGNTGAAVAMLGTSTILYLNITYYNDIFSSRHEGLPGRHHHLAQVQPGEDRQHQGLRGRDNRFAAR